MIVEELRRRTLDAVSKGNPSFEKEVEKEYRKILAKCFVDADNGKNAHLELFKDAETFDMCHALARKFTMEGAKCTIFRAGPSIVFHVRW